MACARVLGCPDIADDHVHGALGQLFGHGLAHRVQLRRRFLDGYPRRHAHVDHVHRFIDVREEGARKSPRGPTAGNDEEQRRAHDRPPKGENVTKEARVTGADVVDEPFDGLSKSPVLGVTEEMATRHGGDGHADKVRRDHRHGDRECERREELLREPSEEKDGHEYGHRRERRRKHGQRHRVRPLERSLSRTHPHALVPVDGLQDDDRVVDEPAHRERETAEGERVQRLAAGIQDDQRDGERQGNGDRNDNRAAQALEKDEDDEADQDESLNDLLLQAVIRRANEGRLIEDGFHLHSGRQVVEPLDHSLHGIHDFDRVTPRDTKDVEIDSVLPVDGDRLRWGRSAVVDAPHVADQNSLVAADFHGRIPDAAHAPRDRIGVDVGVEFPER